VTALRYQPADRPGIAGERLGDLVVIRGANGTGKTTLARRLLDGTDGDAELALEVFGDHDRGRPHLIGLAHLTIAGLAALVGPGDRRPDAEACAWLHRIALAEAALQPAGAPDSPGGEGPRPPATGRPAELGGDPEAALSRLDALIEDRRRSLVPLEDLPTVAQLRAALDWVDSGAAAFESSSPTGHGTVRQTPASPGPAPGRPWLLAGPRFVTLGAALLGLMAVAVVLMVNGHNRVAAPFGVAAAGAALLVLLAPPPLGARQVPPFLGPIARLLVHERDLGEPGGPGPRPAAGSAVSDGPPPPDPAEAATLRAELEGHLAHRITVEQRHRELRRLIAERDALRRASEQRASAQAAWSRLLERRRQLAAAEVEQARQDAATADGAARADSRKELGRLRRELHGTPSAGVAQLASQLFVQCTAGRYGGLRLDDRPSASRADGAWQPLDTLGRSDQQLAALAAQLAWAEHERPDSPLLLDDILVGLDERNLAATCQTLGRLSQHRQIFVLTSSTQVVDAVRRTRRGVRVLELR
jgi:hypothetical protein